MQLISSLIGAVEVTQERKKHIVNAHPEIKSYFNKLPLVLRNPDEIRKSKIDPHVLLFYKYFARIKKGKYLAAAVKTNKRNFLLTAYLTDKIKAGEIYETKKSF